MSVVHIGKLAACVVCGGKTSFADEATGQPRHVGKFCQPVIPAGAPAPRPAGGTALSDNLQAAAHAVRGRIEQLAEANGGDLDRILKKSIPIVMDLFEEVRTSGRIQIIHHPPYPEILHKPSARAPHQVWLARPKWTNPEPPVGPVERLDVPGAYLNAFITHLPKKALVHDTTGKFDPRQTGVYLITPPAWEIGDLPNPLGNREEPGPVWVTGPTLRQLQRCHVKYQLCGPTTIHESWTSEASEDLLRGLRAVLAHLRTTARQDGDQLLALMVKNMYSKFYASIGESNDNHRMRRPEWSAIIQGQAHANLWERAYKARQAKVQIIRVANTDEIHLVGDWRLLWTEGNELTQMKIKED